MSHRHVLIHARPTIYATRVRSIPVIFELERVLLPNDLVAVRDPCLGSALEHERPLAGLGEQRQQVGAAQVEVSTAQRSHTPPSVVRGAWRRLMGAGKDARSTVGLIISDNTKTGIVRLTQIHMFLTCYIHQHSQRYFFWRQRIVATHRSP